MNLAKILKNVPAGTKLYSVVEGEVEFKYITHDYKIIVLDHNSCEQEYHLSGRLFGCGLDGEVVLFPSKDNRDWDTFCPFKKGDVIVSEGGCIAIFDHMENRSMPDTIVYQALRRWDGSIKVELDTGIGYVHEARLATQEERDLFFKDLSNAGYSWNGDTVVKKRFDPKSFEPYQKVLVRSTPSAHWRCTFFSHMINGMSMCSSDNWPYCIPYENNEHLAGKTDNCDDFYQWWKNN